MVVKSKVRINNGAGCAAAGCCGEMKRSFVCPPLPGNGSSGSLHSQCLTSAYRYRGNRMKGVYSLGSLVPKIASSCWVAPNAAVVGNVIIKEHASIWFGATVRGDQPEPITIGAHTNIQDGSALHSDAGVPLTVGDGVTVGHQAMLHGCTIGNNTLIGIGAVLQFSTRASSERIALLVPTP